MQNQMTPPSEYENLPLQPKTQPPSSSSSANVSPAKNLPNGSSIPGSAQPGVKSIHITHNPSSSQSEPPQHPSLMNVSSTSSTSSYYSTGHNSQNQSPNNHSGAYGSPSLYQAKSTSNLTQHNQISGGPQSSPAKSATSSAISNLVAGGTANGNTVVKSKSTNMSGNSVSNGTTTSFKGMCSPRIDDCGHYHKSVRLKLMLTNININFARQSNPPYHHGRLWDVAHWKPSL